MSEDLHQPNADGGPDWAAYYRRTEGRVPRPLFAKGMAALEAVGVAAGRAVEIGFGDGTESLALLDAGWHVTAIDPTPAAADHLRALVSPSHAEHLEIVTAPAQDATFLPFDLLYAGYALSFIDPGAFGAFWARVRDGLRPGGYLVMNIFGVRDTWADDASMTFVTRGEVDRLLSGLEVIAVDEEDADGDSFVGPKHWHVFDLIARRPVSTVG